MLDESLLPKNGRQVRCVACQHIWHQVPETLPMTPPPLKGIMDMAIDSKITPEKRTSWLGWVVVLTLIIFTFSFLSFGRDYIVKFWPKSERLYNLIGLHVTLPGEGLSISNAASLTHQEGLIEMIQVSGDITNTSPQVRPIPLLKIKVLGSNSHQKCKDLKSEACVLDYWEHRLSENSLLPGEQIHFETASRPKVEDTQQISVEF
ncbi:MAG: hypothetical protein JSR85_01960 [Proteobacteria bacterium]|nr:hypothetical protein [Pseudomonadota bacterium]